MKIINLEKILLDINENEIFIDETGQQKATVKYILVQILGTSSSENFIESIDLALKIKNANNNEIEINEKDALLIKEKISKSFYIDFIKYQLIKNII